MNMAKNWMALGLASAAMLLATAVGAQEQEVPEACALPGEIVLTDPAGDAALGTGLLPNPLALHDYTELSIAELEDEDGAPLLAFRLKVAAFDQDPLRSTGYFSSFVDPFGVVRGVRMNIDLMGEISYFSYVASGSLDTGDGGITDGRFVEAGTERPAAAGSGFTPDGEILIIVRPQDLNLLFPGDRLAQFNAGITLTIGADAVGSLTDILDAMPDDLVRQGGFRYQARVDCPLDATTSRASTAVANRGGGALPLFVLLLAGLAGWRRRH